MAAHEGLGREASLLDDGQNYFLSSTKIEKLGWNFQNNWTNRRLVWLHWMKFKLLNIVVCHHYEKLAGCIYKILIENVLLQSFEKRLPRHDFKVIMTSALNPKWLEWIRQCVMQILPEWDYNLMNTYKIDASSTWKSHIAIWKSHGFATWGSHYRLVESEILLHANKIVLYV